MNITNAPARSEPNVELLLSQGWSLISIFGPYCSAWKGNSECLFVWQSDHWDMMAWTAGAQK
jgi:hypothetical protein